MRPIELIVSSLPLHLFGDYYSDGQLMIIGARPTVLDAPIQPSPKESVTSKKTTKAIKYSSLEIPFLIFPINPCMIYRI